MFSLVEQLMRPVVPLALRMHKNANAPHDVSQLTEQELRRRKKKKECDRLYRARLRREDEEFIKKAGGK